MTATEATEAKSTTEAPCPIRSIGHDWCPECEGELVQSNGQWHHIFGERGDCRWTD